MNSSERREPMTSIPTVTVKFENNVDEHVHAAELYYKTTFYYKADKVVAILLLLYGIYVTIILGVKWWTVIFIILAPVEWFNLLSPYKLQARLWFKWNPKFHEAYEISFSEDAIHFKTLTIDSNINWTMYNKMLEDDQIFLMIYGKRMYSVIPKRVFANDDEINAFRKLAQTHGL
jgi:hypothetical protein